MTCTNNDRCLTRIICFEPYINTAKWCAHFKSVRRGGGGGKPSTGMHSHILRTTPLITISRQYYYNKQCRARSQAPPNWDTFAACVYEAAERSRAMACGVSVARVGENLRRKRYRVHASGKQLWAVGWPTATGTFVARRSRARPVPSGRRARSTWVPTRVNSKRPPSS